MPVWYILRGGQQIGPYTPQALLSMLAQGGLFPQDQFLDASSGKRWGIEKAIKKWRKTSGLPPRKRHRGLIVFAVIVLLIGGFIGYKILTKTSDKLTLGASTAVASADIGLEGGTVSVSGGALDGFAISVPEDAYGKDTRFKVSTRPITGHKLGPLFNPASPLITVDNGHVFARESLTVTIPIQKTDDEFAMGFYYDEKTGKLEGIPVVSQDDGQITLLTNHFSDIIVSKVPQAELAELDVDTGFMPGCDDWQFTNYGSYIAPGGHCAGQSITALWYFDKVYGAYGNERLYGLFDNYGMPSATARFWQDDSEAYRFASVIQETINWRDLAYKTQKKLSNDNGTMTMNAFIYAMELTGEPQFLEIWGLLTAQDGTQENAGHAIIAYKVEDNRIYVADPNYPGATDRYVQFSGARFETYSSGQNAAAIASGDDIPFTDFYYIAQSSLIDFDVIDDEYSSMTHLTAGNGVFPAYTLQRLTSLDENGNAVWSECPDTLKVNSKDNIANMGDYYEDKVCICVSAEYAGLTVALYRGLDNASLVESKITDGNGQAIFNIVLKDGINDIGFYIYWLENGNEHYIDFKRITVEYDLSAGLTFEKDRYDVICSDEASFAVRPRKAPADVTYAWDFGDGSSLETAEPNAAYTYTTGGDYTLTCSMIDNDTGKTVAEARAAVTALELYGTWDFSYVITEAGAVNSIANFFGDMILGVIQQIFPDQGVPDSADINIEGTVVSGKLDVYQPDNGIPADGRISVELRQESSSTDFIDVSTTPIPGYLKLDKGKITIVLTGDASADGSTGAMTFKGTFSQGVINGSYTASGIMSGSFEARK